MSFNEDQKMINEIWPDVVFSGKTLYSHSTSFDPRVKMNTGELSGEVEGGDNFTTDWYPSSGEK